MIDRRTFLAAPLVFGLRDLLAQQPRDDRPAWWSAALDRMKATGRGGVVLVAPPAPVRPLFGERLAALVPGPDPAVRRLFGQAVFIVLDPALARILVRGEGETCNRILLAPDGRRLAADQVPLQAFARPELFAASFRPFVEGPDGARLAERATALEPSLPDDAKRALEGLRSDAPAAREAAAAELLRRADGFYPLLLHRARAEADVDVRARLAQILDRVVVQADPRLAGPALPYGVQRIAAEPELPRGAGCGPCGLVVVSAPSRDFLECLLR
jgi:hypothetical protein